MASAMGHAAPTARACELQERARYVEAAHGRSSGRPAERVDRHAATLDVAAAHRVREVRRAHDQATTRSGRPLHRREDAERDQAMKSRPTAVIDPECSRLAQHVLADEPYTEENRERQEL